MKCHWKQGMGLHLCLGNVPGIPWPLKELRGKSYIPILTSLVPLTLLGCAHSRIMPDGPECDQGDAVGQHCQQVDAKEQLV